MTTIDVEKDSMDALMKSTEGKAIDLMDVLCGFSSTADGGIASEKIAFIIRAAMEASQKAEETARTVCALGRAAIDGQLKTDEEIMDALDNFAAEVGVE